VKLVHDYIEWHAHRSPPVEEWLRSRCGDGTKEVDTLVACFRDVLENPAQQGIREGVIMGLVRSLPRGHPTHEL
jgi:hypothetical protein